MNDIFWFLGTAAVSCLAGWAAYKMKLPMGGMIGAMVAAAAFNIITGHGVFYREIRVGIQLLTGAMIGSKIGASEIRSMKTVFLPSVILLAGMAAHNLIFGTAAHLIGGLDAATSFFAMAPGGASDMSMISAELGAVTAHVAVLQIMRIVIIISVLPSVFKAIERKQHKNTRSEEMSLAGDKKSAPFRYTRRGLRLLAGLIVFSVCGGLIFRAIGIPAGAVAGSMVFGVTYTVIFGKAVYPKQVRPWQQMFAGAYIGASIDKSSVISMKTLFVPLLIMAAGIMIFVFLMSFIIRKTTKMDYVTCLFACTPGGVTEMALLSEELGADTPKIAMVQTSRIVLVIMLFPTMIEFVLPFFV